MPNTQPFIYALNIDHEIANDAYLSLVQYVAPEKQRRLTRFYHRRDAQRSLLGELLVRIHYCKYHHLKNNEIQFSTNAHNKPCLASHPDLHFNISHAGDWIVSAHHHLPIGIDVEQIRPIDLSIAQRFFTSSEYKDIMLQPSDLKFNRFYQFWTLKESFIKAMGQGLALSLNDFSFEIMNGRTTFKTDLEHPNFKFKCYSLSKDYQLAVCAETCQFPDTFPTINLRFIADSLHYLNS